MTPPSSRRRRRRLRSRQRPGSPAGPVGLRDRRGRRPARLRRLRRAATRRSCSSRRRRSCTPASGRPRSTTSAATGAWSRTTAAATAARIGRSTRSPTSTSGCVGDLGVVMDATDTDRAVLVGLCIDGVWRSIRFAAANPERVARHRRVRHRRAAARAAPAALRGGVRHVRRRAADDRRLGQAQPPLLAARLRRLRPVLLQRDHLRAALDEGDRGRDRLGARRLGRRDARRARRAVRHHAPRRSRPSAARSPARCSSSTAPRTRCQPPARAAAARGADRRAARARRGRRPHDPGPPPGARQPADPRLRGLARRRPVDDRVRDHLDPGARPASAARCTSRRRSASATPSATSRSRTSCASSIPTSRSTGSRSTR